MNVSHAAELDLEAGSTDFLQLVIRRLADGGDVEVSEAQFEHRGAPSI